MVAGVLIGITYASQELPDVQVSVRGRAPSAQSLTSCPDLQRQAQTGTVPSANQWLLEEEGEPRILDPDWVREGEYVVLLTGNISINPPPLPTEEVQEETVEEIPEIGGGGGGGGDGVGGGGSGSRGGKEESLGDFLSLESPMLSKHIEKAKETAFGVYHLSKEFWLGPSDRSKTLAELAAEKQTLWYAHVFDSVRPLLRQAHFVVGRAAQMTLLQEPEPADRRRYEKELRRAEHEMFEERDRALALKAAQEADPSAYGPITFWPPSPSPSPSPDSAAPELDPISADAGHMARLKAHVTRFGGRVRMSAENWGSHFGKQLTKLGSAAKDQLASDYNHMSTIWSSHLEKLAREEEEAARRHWRFSRLLALCAGGFNAVTYGEMPWGSTASTSPTGHSPVEGGDLSNWRSFLSRTSDELLRRKNRKSFRNDIRPFGFGVEERTPPLLAAPLAASTRQGMIPQDELPAPAILSETAAAAAAAAAVYVIDVVAPAEEGARALVDGMAAGPSPRVGLVSVAAAAERVNAARAFAKARRKKAVVVAFVRWVAMRKEEEGEKVRGHGDWEGVRGWGEAGRSYVDVTDTQREEARRLVAAGFDVIVGTGAWGPAAQSFEWVSSPGNKRDATVSVPVPTLFNLGDFVRMDIGGTPPVVGLVPRIVVGNEGLRRINVHCITWAPSKVGPLWGSDEDYEDLVEAQSSTLLPLRDVRMDGPIPWQGKRPTEVFDVELPDIPVPCTSAVARKAFARLNLDGSGSRKPSTRPNLLVNVEELNSPLLTNDEALLLRRQERWEFNEPSAVSVIHMV